MSLGVGDIMAISGLALKVCTAYKDAPGDYRNISDEVESLDIIINQAAHHFESTTLSDNCRQEGHKVLRGCHNVLQDLDALIEKYNSLATKSTSTSISQALERLKLSASLVIGTEDIATLRARLTSNTTLLNGFMQSCKLDAMQAQLNSTLGLRRTMSRDSIVSFAGSINTKKAYKKFCKGLFNIGVTAEMISQKEKEIQDIFKTQHPAASSQMDDSTSADPNPAPHPQLPEVGNSSDVETSPISSILPAENDLNSRSRFGWVRPPIDFLVGPLMLAVAEAGNAKRLVSTLEYVRNISFVDSKGETALHKAAAKGHKDKIQLLLSKGLSLEAKNTYGWTPMYSAARHGHTSTVELLLSKGASLEAKNPYGWTPMHSAAQHGHTSTVELLLSKGASLEAKDSHGETPLQFAVRSGHNSIVELLLSKGASLEAKNMFGETPLHVAAKDSNTSTVELLLSKGASLEVKNIGGWTPLHRAAWNGNTSIVELLLSKGALLEAKDMRGWTPLHHAVWVGHNSTVALLLSKGASLEVKNMGGWTPLHRAAWDGNTSIVELLLSKGASLEVKNEGGSTPLDLATSGGHPDTVKLLKSKAAKLVIPENI